MVIETVVYEFILHAITCITICIQLYVIYVIYLRSPKNMKEYRFFLITFTVWDLIFTLILGVLLQPDPVGRLLSARMRGLSGYFGNEAQLLTVGCLYQTPIKLFFADLCSYICGG
jgi:hypothetical protein